MQQVHDLVRNAVLCRHGTCRATTAGHCARRWTQGSSLEAVHLPHSRSRNHPGDRERRVILRQHACKGCDEILQTDSYHGELQTPPLPLYPPPSLSCPPRDICYDLLPAACREAKSPALTHSAKLTRANQLSPPPPVARRWAS